VILRGVQQLTNYIVMIIVIGFQQIIVLIVMVMMLLVVIMLMFVKLRIVYFVRVSDLIIF